MKNIRSLLLLPLALMMLFWAAACSKTGNNKTEVPEEESRAVTTRPASDLSAHTATLCGSVYWKVGLEAPGRVFFLLIESGQVDRGDAQFPTPQQMIAAGAQNVPVLDLFSEAGVEHSFSVDLEGLESRSLYFYCAAAQFGEAVLYGAVRSFNTSGPGITNLTASNATATTMTVRFGYEGNDVMMARVRSKEPGSEQTQTFNEPSVQNGVYTFNLSGLNPNVKYSVTAELGLIGNKVLSEFINATTLKGVVVQSISCLSTSATVTARAWYNASVPTLYYTTDPYVIANDYKSASHVTMNRIAVSGMPEGSGRDFSVVLQNLQSSRKYYILVELGNLTSEVSSFTTPN